MAGQSTSGSSSRRGIGLTYQFDPKTVIRAGYGRSFDTGVFGSIFGHTVTQNIPVLANQQINSPTPTGEAFTLDVGPTPYTFSLRFPPTVCCRIQARRSAPAPAATR